MGAENAYLPLFVWLSPAFPVGGFAFSHGLEWAVEAGDIRDSATLGRWLDDLLRYGALRADAALLAAAWSRPDQASDINDLALALAPSAERRLETAAQGTAFLAAIATAWPSPALQCYSDTFAEREIAYPIALGLAARAHAIPLSATLPAFLIAALGNLVSAVLRLGPIGQSEAQAILARLTSPVADLAREIETSDCDDFGSCAWRSDIAAMRHETQYSRLFRS